MPEMRMGVARAIANKMSEIQLGSHPPWHDPEFVRDALAVADAAIAAMREVDSLPVLLAGKTALFCCAEDPTIEGARACWWAMIDEMLAEASKGR
jgi:hypothetical protein